MINNADETYPWTLSDGIKINPTIYQGQSADYNHDWLGNSARHLAKIKLSNSATYKFATYLFCDYTSNFIISNTLKIYITGTFYDPVTYQPVTSVQRIFLNEKLGQEWGTESKFAQLRGSIGFKSDIH